ncbi:MAG TPA: crosslink repair DNA glycosylase YcaQ family protein [Pyrinomonadaceae bacterium]|nr:crosslink repair DNA glycosylase YcaQ family protein [Pyrinomonadaceae bacterium]
MSHSEAQAVMVAALGLGGRAPRAATKMDVLRAIRRMSVLQIDTIHVVARSPYLVLWSRLGDYEPRWLDELLAEGALFEYWSHEASFLPVEDFPLYRHRMIAPGSMGWKYSHDWIEAHRKEVDRVLALVRASGPVRSKDFARTDGKSGGWWEWKPEKRALEMLFTAGELMIARRDNFQRVYDLRERVLPSWDDSRLPSIEETERALALKAVRALGITRARWVGDYFRTERRATAALVRTLGDEGLLRKVRVEGWDDDGDAYLHPDNLPLLEAVSKERPALTTLLSPFDPLVWDRARAREMFGFDYRLECYTPAERRRYGYFTLPILRRGALVGRLDAKAHRKERYFEVKALYLEPGIAASEELAADLAGALLECAAWHRTPEVKVQWSKPAKLLPLLRRALKAASGSFEAVKKAPDR